jgi:hypothetical protein
MSVALGEDMQSAALQVGKAFAGPDPRRHGVARVGVLFTADQQAQIGRWSSRATRWAPRNSF